MIKINGTTIKTPNSFTVNIYDVTKSDRTAAGTMVKDTICTKRKLELNYPLLTVDEAAALLTLIAPDSFSVEYPDPQIGALTTKTFYAGDRAVPMLDFKNNVPRYKDVKFNLIEV